MRFLLLLIFLTVGVQYSEGQIFGRRPQVSGYTQTNYGYNYRGRKYVRGVDLPDNIHCPCPMCVDLMIGYMETHPEYRPLSHKHLWPAKLVKENINVEDVKQNASVKLIGTPPDVVKRIVDVFEIGDEPFLLLDPGCGDARILIEAAKRGANGVGIEINPETYKIAVENVKKHGFEDKIVIFNGDSRDFNFKDMNVDGIALFLFPDLINDLKNNLEGLTAGKKVVSYSHDLGMEGTIRCEDLYVWIKGLGSK